MARPGPPPETAPAKLNLALHVCGRRPDGFHDLDSLVCFADAADRVHIAQSQTDRLTISGPFAEGLMTDGANLVLRAARAFRARWPRSVPTGLNIELEKNLPVASGIGGGSADAAATLRGLAVLSGMDLSREDLAALAAGIGADVPVCLWKRPVVMRGIGSEITPAPDLPALHAVLVNPLRPSPTPEVFRRLKSRENPPMPELPDRFETAADLAQWLENTRNDLEPAARTIVPRISEIESALSQTEGCLFARLSGSGATIFGLYESAQAAKAAAKTLSARWPDHWVITTRLLEAGETGA